MREDFSIYLNNSEILLIQYTTTRQETQEIALFQKQLFFFPMIIFAPECTTAVDFWPTFFIHEFQWCNTEHTFTLYLDTVLFLFLF